MSLFVVACAPPDPKEVAEKASADLKALVREAWRTTEQTNTWPVVDDAFAGFGLPRSTFAQPRVPAVTSLDQGLDSAGEVAERVFVESNVVEREGASLTFQVRGLDVCLQSNGLVDTSCAQNVDRLQLHLRVSGDLDVAVLVGAAKAEAFVVRLRTGKSLAVEVDLSRAQAAVTALLAAMPSSQLPSLTASARGRVEYRLEKHGPQDFSASMGVLEDVRVDVVGADGVSRTASTAAKNPLVFVRLEGPNQKGTVKVDVGATRFLGLLTDLGFGGLEGARGRAADAFLAGLSAELLVDSTGARVQNVGLGNVASTLHSGQALLFSGDFNPDHGRRAGLSWAMVPGGVRLTASPAAQLDVTLGLGVLATANETVPDEFVARYQASFTAPSGRSPSLTLFTAARQGEALYRIDEGTLKVSVSDPLVAPRTFTAGQCIGRNPQEVRNGLVESGVVVPCF
ncbi:MAG: hypothetical protein Q8L48_29770 [Archangium sp.]|nr:hypothetical protein [Archangium sp.]